MLTQSWNGSSQTGADMFTRSTCVKNKLLSLIIVIGALSLVGLLAACGASVQPAPGQEPAVLSAQASSPQSSASAAITHTMPMTSSMPADHAMHHPGMDASAAMTHTMPMAGGMDHSAHMAQMTKDMQAMVQHMAAMHSSMAITHTMPMTGASGSVGLTHEQHMGHMMIMMGRMMQMMGEMQGGMSGMGSGMCDMMGGAGCKMMGGAGGMDHGSMGSGMCDMMGGEDCKMMGGAGGMDHGNMGSGMCDMMGGEGCGMTPAHAPERSAGAGVGNTGGMGAGSPITPTQAMTSTTTPSEANAALQGTADTRRSEVGRLTVSATPLNLADPQAATLDFVMAGDGPGIDPGVDLAPLASLRFGSQQIAATAWRPETGVLSFPASDLTGIRTVTLMIRNLAGAPLRTFAWTLGQ
jgi:hypothetical protein